MQSKDISDIDILKFLQSHAGKLCTWHAEGYGMPTIADSTPKGIHDKLRISKMRKLIQRGLVSGCGCGCRGDYEITQKGIDYLKQRDN